MVWNLIVPIVGRYATALTLPIAMGLSSTISPRLNENELFDFSFPLVLGGLGYYIEKRCRGVPFTPEPHEKPIIDERIERQDKEEPTASPYRMETVVPKTIFERNNPAALRKTQ